MLMPTKEEEIMVFLEIVTTLEGVNESENRKQPLQKNKRWEKRNFKNQIIKYWQVLKLRV